MTEERPAIASVAVCYHCGQAIHSADPFVFYTPDRQAHPVCCLGCQMAAQAVQSNRGSETQQELYWQRYDLTDVQQQFVHSEAGISEASISAEAIDCAACSVLIERELKKLNGLLDVDVNVTHRRVLFRWQNAELPFSGILKKLASLGFTPQPLTQGADTALLESRAALKRLFISAIGMMQVMMYAVGLYAGMFQGISPDFQQFLHVVSMVVATPVVLYSGQPFFKGAWRDLKHMQPGMDVPVALAIAIAYTASVYAVFSHHGTIYFDSVTMFIFFLSLGRFAEMKARHRAGAATEAFAQLLPTIATRIEDGEEKTVAAESLRPGDIISIKPGETIPTDCSIISGETEVDESLLTGESTAIPKTQGEALIGGSVNRSGILTARVEQVGAGTVLSHIGRLLDRAQSERPALSQLADRIARYFVTAVISIAAIVGLYWSQAEPGRALEIMLAVLVVTCPCALSLATPAALTVAIGRMAREGLLVTQGHAIERLARCSHALFDKTGTLTFGKPSIRRIYPLADLTAADCLMIAASLEQQSEHPVAAAFQSTDSPKLDVDHIANYPGLGLEGSLDWQGESHRYRIGKLEFVAALGADCSRPQPNGDISSSWVALADQEQVLAWFELGDTGRPGIGTMCAQLKELGISVEMMSGDQAGAVDYLASQLSIAAHAQLSPNQKLDNIRSLQLSGQQVLMVGDGINDAPVLAGADVSIAMSSGTHLAQSSADMVLVQQNITSLPLMVNISRRTMNIIRQNVAWAIGYNLIALPLAAMGLIAPWLAAIGMSGSSLIVVLNALRLGYKQRENPRTEIQTAT